MRAASTRFEARAWGALAAVAFAALAGACHRDGPPSPDSVVSGGPSAPRGAPQPSTSNMEARVTLNLADAPLRDALATLARLRHKPMFVDPSALGRAACARLDALGTPEASEATAFLDARLRPWGLALLEGTRGIALEARGTGPPPTAFDRQRCELLPFTLGEPLAGTEPSALAAIERAVGPAEVGGAGEPGRAFESRTIAEEGRRLLCAHAQDVLATARIALEPAPPAGSEPPVLPPAEASARPERSVGGEDRWALRIFFLDGYRDRGPLYALGLRDADRVLSFAGGAPPLASSALAALDTLCGPATSATLDVERKGALLELRYSTRHEP